MKKQIKNSLKKPVEISDKELDKWYYYGGMLKFLVGMLFLVIFICYYILNISIIEAIIYDVIVAIFLVIVFYLMNKFLIKRKIDGR